MVLQVYGSGSLGNCYSLTDKEGKSLILDAGINPKTVFREILPGDIEAVLITHSHGDHSKYVKDFLDRFILVERSKEDGGSLEPFKARMFGNFKVIPLNLRHDVPCIGFLIGHKELVAPILYATDTNGIPYDFDRLSLAMIEADYDTGIIYNNIEKGIIDTHRAARVRNSHQSIRQAIQFLKEGARQIDAAILVHLSKDNADSDRFKERAERETGIPTEIAKQGLKININGF